MDVSLANTVFSYASPVCSTTSSQQPITSHVADINTPIIDVESSPSCSTRVNSILDSAAVIDNNVITNAIRAMASSITDINAKIAAMERTQSSFNATATDYFKRPGALENKVDSLDRGNVAQIRASHDALATARPAEREYINDQLRVVGMPRADLNVVQRAFKELAARLRISVPTDAVTAVRP